MTTEPHKSSTHWNTDINKVGGQETGYATLNLVIMVEVMEPVLHYLTW